MQVMNCWAGAAELSWAQPAEAGYALVAATSLPAVAGGCGTRQKLLRNFLDSDSPRRQIPATAGKL